jgi:hypothetical protein
VLPAARRVNFGGNAERRHPLVGGHFPGSLVDEHYLGTVKYHTADTEGEPVVAGASRQEVIRKRMEALEAELTELEQFGEDVYDDGAVLVFDMHFSDGVEAPYVYAAIKAKGLWFVTGQHNMSYWRWDQLVNFWKGKCTSIMLLKADREVFSRNNGKHAEVTATEVVAPDN